MWKSSEANQYWQLMPESNDQSRNPLLPGEEISPSGNVEQKAQNLRDDRRNRHEEVLRFYELNIGGIREAVQELPQTERADFFRALFEYRFSMRKKARAEGLGFLFPPVPSVAHEEAPPVDAEILKRLVSAKEPVLPEEAERVYRLIDTVQTWYEAYHQLLSEDLDRQENEEERG